MAKVEAKSRHENPQEIVVVDYDPAWPAFFEEERARIAGALGDLVSGIASIEHVGSTAVLGLQAKPIIDILIGVHDLTDGEQSISPMESLGYESLGEHGIPGRYYFRRGIPRTHHVHLVKYGCPDWVDTVLFRDYLRENPEACIEYAVLKRKLAVRYRTDRERYTDAKRPFIQSALEQARRG